MNLEFGKQSSNIDRGNTYKCQCIHCESVKTQQLESERRWVKMHRLVDR